MCLIRFLYNLICSSLDSAYLNTRPKKVNFVLLTHYRTTNFRLFQTERVCRRQFQIWRKWQKVIQTSNFSFSHSVFKRLVSMGRQKESLCGNGGSSVESVKIFTKWSQFQIWWKWQIEVLKTGRNNWKKEKLPLRAISPFPTVFSRDLYGRQVKTRYCLGRG